MRKVLIFTAALVYLLFGGFQNSAGAEALKLNM
jgi:hypothetical protein